MFLRNISNRVIIFFKFNLPGKLGLLFGKMHKLSERHTIM